MTADLSLLHPAILPLYNRLVADLTAKGWRCHAIQTYRTSAQQDALPAGSTSLAGGQSKHNFTIDGKPASKAFDLGFFDGNGGYISDGSAQCYTDAGALWMRYGAASPALGLRWGGLWHSPHDPDHFEIA